MTDLKEKLANVSSAPGAYLMKDDAGKVIYVGKARNLKKRLASYFKSPDQLDMKTGVLVRQIVAFDTIITGTENEALILESNLIRRYRPRYNVILKDDKRYPSLRLDVQNPWPAISVVRKIENDGALYFGPFTSSRSVRQTLNFINKTFKLRKCKTKVLTKRDRPCLNCQMDGCLGPCCRKVDRAVYDGIVREVILFLKGRTPELIQEIETEMAAAAAVQAFEKAAELRDKMFGLKKILEKQVAISKDLKDRDVLALARSARHVVITRMAVRGGYLIDSRHFTFPPTLSTDAGILDAFIRQYYEKSRFIPPEILIPAEAEDAELLEGFLKTLKGKKVSLLQPRRGEKAHLLKMAVQNAGDRLRSLTESAETGIERLSRLQKRLRMQRFPERIECFDNSNISGTSPVAGMVVFENGAPKKSAYRKYKIRTVEEHDDYAYMAEVLTRRLGKGAQSEPYPDLLMVDGGKGQLGIALSVIRELGLEGAFEVAGIAKKDEKAGETEDKIYQPGRANPVIWGRDGDLLLFLQQIRDEAHRFAITFHRSRRRKNALTSEMDTIPGIGRQRKKALLKHFGSIRKIRAATLEELGAVPGISLKMAEAIRNTLRP
ncbi:excinuclease ABC subunit C [Desulfonema ishimotonii]|uniref:UvrABC system protein C n=1 Tax=Desulfonema ishimotonii TaxID=45657 RepID=A0A401FUH9_9BACT|nr:excinuclease ABC subunit UvrC [Desulfonema ishimotonii]GBC60632.1 excinuclease ABC subunit C [Desulfonema ishimotonii]